MSDISLSLGSHGLCTQDDGENLLLDVHVHLRSRVHNNRPGLINADRPWLFMGANGTVCVCVSVYRCLFATVTWPDAPAVAAAWVLSHWLVVSQLSPPHSNQGVWSQVNTSSTFLSVMLRSFTDG